LDYHGTSVHNSSNSTTKFKSNTGIKCVVNCLIFYNYLYHYIISKLIGSIKLVSIRFKISYDMLLSTRVIRPETNPPGLMVQSRFLEIRALIWEPRAWWLEYLFDLEIPFYVKSVFNNPVMYSCDVLHLTQILIQKLFSV